MTTPVVAYPRASSLSQLDGFGLEAQERIIREYCERSGFSLAADAVFREEAVRGKTDYEHREAFMAMLDYMREHDVKVVVIAKLDRLARDLVVQETIIADLKRSGFRIFSVAEPDLDSDDETRVLFRQVMGAIAQWDAVRIAKRMASGRRERAYRGERAVGAVPYGYRAVEIDKRRVTQVFEEEAKWVRYIFAGRRGGGSMQFIADDLNERGVPSPRGAKWYASTIKTILDNRIYDGLVSYHAGGETPIVSENGNLALL